MTVTDTAPPRPIPGPVSVEHLAITVPDLDQACSFFVRALGARELRRNAFGADDGTDMATSFGSHPATRARLAVLDLHGTRLEVFEFDAPDQRTEPARNVDVGGHHIGLRVADLDAAVEALTTVPGLQVLGPPSPMTTTTGASRRWVYVLTPWGLQLELAEEAP